MKLKDLANKIDAKEIIGNPDTVITGISIKDKEINKGDLYVCIVGANFDGHKFSKEAKMCGASAILAEYQTECDLPHIIVKDARQAMSRVAAAFYNNPAKKMKIIGVTGTNGKTSVSHLIKGILDKAGKKVGLIGTLGIYFGNTFLEATLTTPDPIYLHKILAEMYGYGIDYVVMEVSAHAIELKKIDGIDFEVGVFTNFTQDHLDFFENMENYKQAKLKFINSDVCKYIVTNSDDQLSREIINSAKILTYGCYNPSDVFAINIINRDNGMSFVINLFDDIYAITTKLMGMFNVYNIMAALATSTVLGIDRRLAVEAICEANVIEGRLEKVTNKNGVNVYVDYAHTPDGLQRSLEAIKNVTKGKVICLFGCGGNRDYDKRSKMGEISGELADFTVITSDNPRYEEPMSIIKEIEDGVVTKTKEFIIIEKRSDAIKYALKIAKPSDSVLIAGKGAEKYQEILGVKHLYNDKEEIFNYYSGM